MGKKSGAVGRVTAAVLALALGLTISPVGAAFADDADGGQPGGSLPADGAGDGSGEQPSGGEPGGTSGSTEPPQSDLPLGGAVPFGGGVTPLGGPTPLAAPDLSIGISVVSDGTPDWEGPSFVPGTGANPGNDDSPNNGIVRVNDTVVYQLQLGSAGTVAENATFTVKFPRGMALEGALPLYCDGPGSSLTPATVTASQPITAATLAALPEQTLVCNYGTLNAGVTFEQLPVKVLNATHNGTELPILEASITADEVLAPVQAASLPSVTATSRLKWDISKNGVNLDPNTGPGGGLLFNVCSFDASRYCYRASYTVLIAAPTGGKGAMPAVGDVTFVDDVSAAALYTNLGALDIVAIDANPALYGARLTNGGQEFNAPAPAISGANATAINSVRDSGTLTIDQPVPGQLATLTLSGTDWSLQSYPSQAQSGAALPAGVAYAVSRTIYLEIPRETVDTFGVLSGGAKQLQLRNSYTDLHIEGFDPANGEVQTSADQPLWNDSRTSQVSVQTGLGASATKDFVGPAGDAQNMGRSHFTPGSNSYVGPPGGATIRSGEIVVAEGQEIVSLLGVIGSNTQVPGTVSAVVCDSWDNTRLHLRDDDRAQAPRGGNGTNPTQVAGGQYIPGGGKAVWVSGYNNVPNTAAITRFADNAAETAVVQLQVEYASDDVANIGTGAASSCGSGSWYADRNDPALGNDPALAAQGIYTGVNRVRVRLVLPAPVAMQVTPTGTVAAYVSIGLQVAEPQAGRTSGDILPNWLSAKYVLGAEATMQEVLDAPGAWTLSSYVPSNHSGSLNTGDRLKLGKAHVRVEKQVRRGTSAAFQSTTSLAALAGDVVQYELRPTLTSAAQTHVTQDVWIEDCLPAEQGFVSAAPLPAGTLFTQSSTTPADAKRAACGPNETYLRWIMPDMVVNQPIEPVIVTADISQGASSGAYLNTVEVWSADDPSPASARRSSAGVQLTARASMQIMKTALTPVVQVNPMDHANLELNRWSVALRNAQPVTAPPVSDPDIIDVLPVNGVNGTSFGGTFELVSVTNVTAGATVLYSATAGVNSDVHHASNLAGGSTVWCDAPVGGNLVSGMGACPASLAEVTALRVQKPGAFPIGTEIGFEIAMVGEGNAAGDVYANEVAARATGFEFQVGPVVRPERVVSSSIGDYVWWDLNRDGVQNDYDGSPEPPASGVPVRLTGVDDLGNPVDLSTTTGLDGRYTFAGLRSSGAAGYTVTFTAPTGATFTAQGQGDPALDSDVDPATGAVAVPLAANTANPNIDAGLLANGGLRVQKLLAGAGAGGALVSDGDELVFEVVCTFEGVEIYRDDALTLTVANDEVSVLSGLLGPLPALAECTITETSTDFADALADPRTVTVPWNAATQGSGVVTASLSNHYSAGTVTLGKTLAGNPAAVAVRADFDFEILVTCQIEEPVQGGGVAPVDVFSRLVTIQGGQAVQLLDANDDPVRLPLGTRCFAEEIEDGGASSVTIDHDSFANGAEVLSGTPATLQALAIEVTNTFVLPQGTLVISKLLEGVGVVPFAAADEFTFHVLCAYEGGVVYDDTVTLDAAGVTSIISDPIGPMPATTSCVITETAAGNADAAASPVTVVIPWDPETWQAGRVVASLTNYYSAGTITVGKTLEGDEKAVEHMSDSVFEVLVTCQIEEPEQGGGVVRATLYSGTVKLKGGQIKMLVDDAGDARVLPLGARCFGEETIDGGAARTVINASSYATGVEVAAGTPDALQQLLISVVNHFECTEEVCGVAPQPGGGEEGESGTGGTISGVIGGALPNLGGQAGGFIALAAGVLLLSGVLLLLVQRRRKEVDN